MNKKQRSERARKGAAGLWKGRYEIIAELTKYYAKDRQLEFMTKWPTQHLKDLLDWHRQNKSL